eukprot:TRINITY_DN11768_c0_g1_i1.p1 TRINITY_DN11768_c0_g1~~TRINITY_DN11768_c0_g1_i1.p1  ORF type:complete len:2407 (-),score=325.31 TRINITY_DN11768_c0_g1_i1:206-7426(-)
MVFSCPHWVPFCGRRKAEDVRTIHFKTRIDNTPETNFVKTSKYSIYPFLPNFFVWKNLFEQFTRLANVYFLIISCIQLIPRISPTGKFNTAGTLLLVVAISAIRSAYEDIFRYLRDRKTNDTPVEVLCDGDFAIQQWEDLRVGDIIALAKGDHIPADCLLLWSSEHGQTAYVETANLDGETNLKPRAALRDTAFLDSPAAFADVRGQLVCEGPSRDLYTFTGHLTLQRQGQPAVDAPVGPEQLLLRGTQMRKAARAYALVVYTGKDTKIMMNATSQPFKKSAMERRVNGYLLLLVLFDIFISALSSIWQWYFLDTTEQILPNGECVSEAWYLATCPDAAVEGATSFLTYLILYNNLIPISLYVSLEVSKVVQGWLIGNDVKMFHAPKEMRARANTTAINEDLGQVDYVFSDKTGTLTSNIMRFFKFSVSGVAYGRGVTEIGRAAAARRAAEAGGGSASISAAPLNEAAPSDDPGAAAGVTRPDGFEDDRVEGARWRFGPDAPAIGLFLRTLALCHSVIAEPLDDGTVALQAESPDEGALVAFASRMGMSFVDRDSDSIAVQDGPDVSAVRYEVLAVNPFDSDRKRMSILLRGPDGVCEVLCKGADSSMTPVMVPSRLLSVTLQQTDEFADEGLRTLVLGRRLVSDAMAAEFASMHRAMRTEIDPEKKRRLQEVSATAMEQQLELVGASAIEDKLQGEVPESIAALRAAGIQVWMLTGDKPETAINIGFACQLLTTAMNRIVLSESLSASDAEAVLREATSAMKGSKSGSRPSAKHDVYHTTVPASFSSVAGDVAPKPASPLPDVAACTDTRAASQALGGGTVQREFALVMHGNAMERLLYEADEDGHKAVREEALDLLYGVLVSCSSVVCCRVSPLQKAQMVSLVRRKVPNAITLAIGDGANDVPMIQAAHIGIGISGMEGQQAANTADYAIGQFRFLTRLLFVHGHWNYRRLSRLILFSFYKNIVLYMTQFMFVWFNHSGQSLYESWTITFFNVLFVSFPVFVVACVDRDLDADICLQYPQVYAAVGRSNADFSLRAFVGTFANALAHAALCFFLPAIAFGSFSASLGSETRPDGRILGLYAQGVVMYSCVVWLTNLKLGLEARSWTWLHHLTIWGSVILWYVFLIIYGQLRPPEGSTLFGFFYVAIFEESVPSMHFYLLPVIVVVGGLLRDVIYKVWLLHIRDTSSMSIYHRLRLLQAVFQHHNDSVAQVDTQRNPDGNTDGTSTRGDNADADDDAAEQGAASLFKKTKEVALNVGRDGFLLTFHLPDMERRFLVLYYGSLQRFKVAFVVAGFLAFVLGAFTLQQWYVDEGRLSVAMFWFFFALVCICSVLLFQLAQRRIIHRMHEILAISFFLSFVSIILAHLVPADCATHTSTMVTVMLGILALMRPPFYASLLYMAMALLLYLFIYFFAEVHFVWSHNPPALPPLPPSFSMNFPGATQIVNATPWPTATVVAPPPEFLQAPFYGPLFDSRQLLGRFIQIAVVAAMGLLVVWNNERFLRQMFAADEELRRKAETLRDEEQRSLLLLHNVLPGSIVKKMAVSNVAPLAFSNQFSTGSALASDIVRFTDFSSRHDAFKVIEMLNLMFSKFDRATALLSLEKIKTIGDAYIATGGVPIPDPFHAARIADLSLYLLMMMRETARELGYDLSIRVGIATGPLTAGIVGVQKLTYDVFGPCIHDAEYMEQTGAPDRVQCTPAMAKVLETDYAIEAVIGPNGTQYFLEMEGAPLGRAYPKPADEIEYKEGVVADDIATYLGLTVTDTIPNQQAWAGLSLERPFHPLLLHFLDPNLEAEFRSHMAALDDRFRTRLFALGVCAIGFFPVMWTVMAVPTLRCQTPQTWNVADVSPPSPVDDVPVSFLLVLLFLALLQVGAFLASLYFDLWVRPKARAATSPSAFEVTVEQQDEWKRLALHGDVPDGDSPKTDTLASESAHMQRQSLGDKEPFVRKGSFREGRRRSVPLGEDSTLRVVADSQRLRRHSTALIGDGADPVGRARELRKSAAQQRLAEERLASFLAKRDKRLREKATEWTNRRLMWERVLRVVSWCSIAVALIMLPVVLLVVRHFLSGTLCSFFQVAILVYISSHTGILLSVKMGITVVWGVVILIIYAIRAAAFAEARFDLSDVLAICVTVVIVAMATFSIERSMRRAYAVERRVLCKQTQIEQTVRLSDALLLNVLPHSILRRLRDNPKAMIIDRVESASVLFVYFDGLNVVEEATDPLVAMSELNVFLRMLDTLCVEFQVEKIKTNPYLVVAGCPEPRPDHAEVLVLLACEFHRVVQRYCAGTMAMDEKTKSSQSGGKDGKDVSAELRRGVRLKIGVHSGRLSSGVLGTNKWVYDVFGDTVNLAARLTSSSHWGSVQVSETTYELTKHLVPFKPRGAVELKGKGFVNIFSLPLQAGQEDDDV